MTTVIMISSDNSIIISPSRQEEATRAYRPRTKHHGVGQASRTKEHVRKGFNGSNGSNLSPGYPASGFKGSAGKSSISSQGSDCNGTLTPDSSFLTPRPLNSARGPRNQISPNFRHWQRPSRQIDALEEYDGEHKSDIRVGATGRSNGEQRELRDNSHTDSDWEEFNASSSSAASTLSSRTSGVSSGAGSCASTDLGRGARVELGWGAGGDKTYQRKYTTLNRPKPILSPHRGVLRHHSFQLAASSTQQRFIPSEHSAFKVPALPRLLEKESHPNKFLTSTPLRETSSSSSSASPGYRSLGRQKRALRGVARHNSYVVAQPVKPIGGGGQILAGQSRTLQRTHTTEHGLTTKETCPGRENSLYFNSSGGADTKGSIPNKTGPGVQSSTYPGVQSSTCPRVQSATFPGVQSVTGPGVQSETGPGVQSATCPGGQSSTCPGVQSSTCPGVQSRPSSGVQSRPSSGVQSRVQMRAATDSSFNTRSLGRRGERRGETRPSSAYCTLRRCPASLTATDKSSSDLSEISEVSLKSSESVKSACQSVQSSCSESSPPEQESRVDLSPLNDNYSKIYSQADLFTNSSYQSVYSTHCNRLQPIGPVFPSGCHRHPPRFQPIGNLDSITSDLGLIGTTTADSAESAPSSECSLSGDCSVCETICRCGLSSSTHTLSNDSGLVKGSSETSEIHSLSEESDSVYRTKSFEGLVLLRNKYKLSGRTFKPDLDRADPRAEKKKQMNRSLLGSSRIAGIVGSGSRILRRHTTYIKNSREEGSKPAIHIHSWNKQEVGSRELRTSSLKRSLINRAGSTYRLSQLFKKDEEGDISISDSQSLDRLSIQTQEEEHQLRPRGRVADWAKDFDNLLSDKYGLYKFTEFLKKEFSHENIYFWCACEKFRLLAEDSEAGLEAARDILKRHLVPGAVDPVNIDASTRLRLISCELADPPPSDLFLCAQNQIYNLMRFDSYPRFLKSEVYTECVRREMNGSSLNDVEFTALNADPPVSVDTGPVLRHRKHKDREKNRLSVLWDSWALNKDPEESFVSLGGDHRTVGECTLTRVVLPNGSTSVVSTTSGESVRALVSRLLEKRGIRLANFEVFSGEKQFDLSEDCDVLACTEVRVEQRISFRLQVPGHRTIGVKTRVYKRIREVLSPLLVQYNWDLGEALVLVEDGMAVNMDDDVATIDNKKLVVRPSREDPAAIKESPNDPEMSLFEGLQIMRKGRLEDQRGTEISFEIPDFLKIPTTAVAETRKPDTKKWIHENSSLSIMSRDAFDDSSPTLGFV